ncbi:hypothetical protein C498_16653 [Haloferax volcanii DS2]|uniref:Uncharacterized protein n=1 Tax=Haloferax volcanii (strain ATCC 29605 / DSM 3757 / JCM 8879 / NBRC 14742 / NCIMB 2012 / VKM B-1768 / DS2) TaxID=309800 RepID=L9ULY2_HALVD|nr:hypothetical protein C498_16653 [Haloferax volcanii DS2]
MDVLARLRSSFVTGLILVTPLAVTVFVLQFAFNRITAALRPVVREVTPFLAGALNYSGDIVFISQVLSALTIAVAISLLGYLASMSLGQRLFGSFERGVRLLPLVRTIYFGVRQVSESLTEPDRRGARHGLGRRDSRTRHAGPPRSPAARHHGAERRRPRDAPLRPRGVRPLERRGRRPGGD